MSLTNECPLPLLARVVLRSSKVIAREPLESLVKEDIVFDAMQTGGHLEDILSRREQEMFLANYGLQQALFNPPSERVKSIFVASERRASNWCHFGTNHRQQGNSNTLSFTT